MIFLEWCLVPQSHFWWINWPWLTFVCWWSDISFKLCRIFVETLCHYGEMFQLSCPPRRGGRALAKTNKQTNKQTKKHRLKPISTPELFHAWVRRVSTGVENGLKHDNCAWTVHCTHNLCEKGDDCIFRIKFGGGLLKSHTSSKTRGWRNSIFVSAILVRKQMAKNAFRFSFLGSASFPCWRIGSLVLGSLQIKPSGSGNENGRA